MNIFEKILARASKKKDVTQGEIVEAEIDKAMINEITGPLAAEAFEQMRRKKLWDKNRIKQSHCRTKCFCSRIRYPNAGNS